ncbi:hypothetical protein [Pseudomonas syringae]|uniref:hypothetical protein n=1 Tax=Pseudomonas syringae TaxID=317 RepID=UPI001480EFE6|nr:hypothetical protein [Pseudomonas syringae]
MTDIEELQEKRARKTYQYVKPALQDQGWGRVLEVADRLGTAFVFVSCRRIDPAANV